MRIEKENYNLREWNLDDSASLAMHANNIRIWNNVRDYFPHPYSMEDGIAFISQVLSKAKPPTDFAIEIAGKAVGGIGIVPNHDVERITAEIGYWLGESFWNKGIMTDVIKDVVQYTFTNFSITKLYAPVFEFNRASMRVLEKAGFIREAILHKAAVKNDKVIDLHYYALFKV
ncbi:MAG TPA: GNAT family protein [Flavisolibacter sp.]|nr:GNAT family protein [Flavisolibacter sp.]